MRKTISISIIIFLIGIPIIVTFCLIIFYKEKIDNITINQETLGQIGDYFGGLLNPLISYCGLVVIILALWVSFISLRNAIKDSASIQARHVEELSQSNAINLLQIFKDILDRVRNQMDDSSLIKELLRLCANSDQTLTEEAKDNILKHTYQIDIKWGASSRYISLLSELNVNADPFQKMIFDSAVALLDSNELEEILCCLATMNKLDLANKIMLINHKRINKNIKKTIEIISKTSTLGKN